jgi:hypothetical protein
MKAKFKTVPLRANGNKRKIVKKNAATFAGSGVERVTTYRPYGH